MTSDDDIQENDISIVYSTVHLSKIEVNRKMRLRYAKKEKTPIKPLSTPSFSLQVSSSPEPPLVVVHHHQPLFHAYPPTSRLELK